MIPPVPQSLTLLPSQSQSQNNKSSPYPQFAHIYHHLITNLLDRDASTRKTNTEHEEVKGRLEDLRIQKVKQRLLIAALNDVAFGDFDDEDHEEATREKVDSGERRQRQDLIAVIVQYLDHGLNGSGRALNEYEHNLMAEQVTVFRAQMAEIINEMERILKNKYDLLYSIASARENQSNSPSYQPRTRTRTTTTSTRQTRSQQDNLSTLITEQQSHLTRLRLTALPKAQYDTTTTLLSLLSLQSQYLESLIRHLELRVHGSESRHLIARAQFLATVAQGMDAKLRVRYLEQRRDLYSPKLREGLGGRMKEMDREEAEVERRRRALQAALDEYEGLEIGGGVGGGRKGGGIEIMRQLGRRYGEVEAEIEDVKRDIERLEREIGGRDMSEIDRGSK